MAKKVKIKVKKRLTATVEDPSPVRVAKWRFSCKAFVDGKIYRVPVTQDRTDYDSIQSEAIDKPNYDGLLQLASQKARQLLAQCARNFAFAHIRVEVHDGHNEAPVYIVEQHGSVGKVKP